MFFFDGRRCPLVNVRFGPNGMYVSNVPPAPGDWDHPDAVAERRRTEDEEDCTCLSCRK